MRRKPLFVGILVVCTSLAGMPAEAFARPPAQKQYDLKIQRVDNQDYLVSPEALRLAYKVKNVGTKPVVSAKVKVKIFRLAGGLQRPQPSYTETLDPGVLMPKPPQDTDEAVLEISSPLGRYRPQVCVKFGKDSKKGNNCKNGPDFSVIPAAWRGPTSFTTGLGSGGVEERADSEGDATFFFDQKIEEGFRYFGTGRVTYSTSGTDIAGCTHSGSGTFDVPSDSVLVMSEDLFTYRIDGPRPQSHAFQGFTDCPPPQFDGPYPAPLLIPAWIQTGEQVKKDDATTIAGRYAPPVGFPGFGWDWSLTAQ